MPLSVSLNPLPQVATHDPLGRAMTDEQRQRLKEQPSPPIEAALAKEKIVERRREGDDAKGRKQRRDGDQSPGGIIDSFA